MSYLNVKQHLVSHLDIKLMEIAGGTTYLMPSMMSIRTTVGSLVLSLTKDGSRHNDAIYVSDHIHSHTELMAAYKKQLTIYTTKYDTTCVPIVYMPTLTDEAGHMTGEPAHKTGFFTIKELMVGFKDLKAATDYVNEELMYGLYANKYPEAKDNKGYLKDRIYLASFVGDVLKSNSLTTILDNVRSTYPRIRQARITGAPSMEAVYDLLKFSTVPSEDIHGALSRTYMYTEGIVESKVMAQDEEIAMLIRKLRLVYGITNPMLAAMASVSSSTVSRYENSPVGMSDKILLKFIRAFDRSKYPRPMDKEYIDGLRSRLINLRNSVSCGFAVLCGESKISAVSPQIDYPEVIDLSSCMSMPLEPGYVWTGDALPKTASEVEVVDIPGNLAWGEYTLDSDEFLRHTVGHILVMSKDTYKTLPKGGLYARALVVVSKDVSVNAGAVMVADVLYTNTLTRAVLEADDLTAMKLGCGKFFILGELNLNPPEEIEEAAMVQEEIVEATVVEEPAPYVVTRINAPAPITGLYKTIVLEDACMDASLFITRPDDVVTMNDVFSKVDEADIRRVYSTGTVLSNISVAIRGGVLDESLECEHTLVKNMSKGSSMDILRTSLPLDGLSIDVHVLVTYSGGNLVDRVYILDQPITDPV